MESVVQHSKRRFWLVILGCFLIILSAGVVAVVWTWQTHAPATPAQQDSILTRLNWQTTI